MHWDVETMRLDVARSLAANTRAMVQVGPGADVAAALLNHTLPENGVPPEPAAGGAAEAPDAGPTPARPSRPKR
jgi:hypothetical protein